MRIEDISVPEIYKTSADFRFFLRWYRTYLEKVRYDTENLSDIYDPLRCPAWLLWMLGETIGYKYDDRLPAAFNRLVLLYFMSMIRNKGSKDGVTLAAEVNLAQFNILEYGKEKEILYDRLEDTAIPVNSVYVTAHTPQGFIDVVYFSDKTPIDACIEYVRPLGMYIFQSSGVRFDAKSKIVLDGRLMNTNDIGISIGPTHVGHYSRRDYASMQKHKEDAQGKSHTRKDVWYRNSDYEQKTTANKVSDWIDPGYRTMYSLELCNNEHIFRSLLSEYDDKERIFGLGYQPQDISVRYPDGYVLPDLEELPDDMPGMEYPKSERQNTEPDDVRRPNAWNLRYDKDNENRISSDVYTIDDDRSSNIMNPRPAVNPVMSRIGDAIALNNINTQYSKTNEDGKFVPEDWNEEE